MKSEFGEPLTEEAGTIRAECIRKLCEVLKLRSASMKARGVSFALEAITNFSEGHKFITQEHADELYSRMERVVLSRLDEFIPHYLVKVFCSFAKAG